MHLLQLLISTSPHYQQASEVRNYLDRRHLVLVVAAVAPRDQTVVEEAKDKARERAAKTSKEVNPSLRGRPMP